MTVLSYHPSSTPPARTWAANAAVALVLAAMWPAGALADNSLDHYTLQILVLIGVNIILATSLNLINGVTGQFSLGHAGFMAVGAYTVGSMLKYFQPEGQSAQWIFLATLLIGGLLAAIAGLAIGIPTLRLRGDYLAIATLGFGEIINIVITNTDSVGPFEIGQASGLHDIPWLAHTFWIYAWVVVCVVCIWRIVHSTKGKAFLAVREDEIAAAAMGIDTTFYKVMAFVIGAFFAGVAGGLLAASQGNIAPNGFGFMTSVELVVMVVLGGSGSITGVILAAIVLTWLPEQLRFLHDWRMVIYSLLLIIMMLVRPEGLLGRRELWWTRRRLAAAQPSGAAMNLPPASPMQ
jgi:branched-chain amino acid transport system permease protein